MLVLKREILTYSLIRNACFMAAAVALCAFSMPLFAAEKAFPDAVGWAASTPGGRGGKIIQVTNLDASGPGSLRDALAAKGPRIVEFTVGGLIDLNRESLRITEPFVTIAGQTAPAPGITIVNGGLSINTHDVVLRHLRIRPGLGDARKDSRWAPDAVSVSRASNVIVDHCSLSWAIDENLSASGPRHDGDTLEEWQQSTSHNITFSHNIIAEGLANATHPKGEHSKGILVHDNVTNILMYGNLFAHNYERSPLLKGGSNSVLVNNFIYDPGQRAVHYNLMALEWGDVPFVTGKLTAIGNVMRAGPSTELPIAFLMLGGHGDLEYFGRDNVAVDRIGQPLPLLGRYSTDAARLIEVDEMPIWWPTLKTIDSDDVERWVLENAGARPWDRDSHDKRVLTNAAEGRGEIIDSEADVTGF